MPGSDKSRSKLDQISPAEIGGHGYGGEIRLPWDWNQLPSGYRNSVLTCQTIPHPQKNSCKTKSTNGSLLAIIWCPVWTGICMNLLTVKAQGAEEQTYVISAMLLWSVPIPMLFRMDVVSQITAVHLWRSLHRRHPGAGAASAEMATVPDTDHSPVSWIVTRAFHSRGRLA